MAIDVKELNSEYDLLVDPEDIEHVLLLVEKSYGIKFVQRELVHIRTFGDLSDVIVAKISLEDKEDCTDQQGFYKLRNAIRSANLTDYIAVTPSTDVAVIFPRKSRRKRIKSVEKSLGFKLDALRPKHWIAATGGVLAVLSMIALFIDWRYACSGIALSIILTWIAEKTGIEMKDKTVGDLVRRMTSVNYLESRRDRGSVNRKEIEHKLGLLLKDRLGLSRIPGRSDVLI